MAAPIEKQRLLSLRKQVPGAPPPPGPAGGTKSVVELLEELLTRGFKERSFDVSDEIVAPKPITDKGDRFDAGEIWDSWIVIPSIDARISFKGPPASNTPIVLANSTMNFQVRAQIVCYVAANVGETGQLNLFLARYRD